MGAAETLRLDGAICARIVKNAACGQPSVLLAPNGSEIRLLPTMKGGGLCHCTLPAGKTSSPVAHRQVEEIWFVVSGEGEVWRKNAAAEETVGVCTGSSLTIPPCTSFQFRNTGATPLCILIVTHAAVAWSPGS